MKKITYKMPQYFLMLAITTNPGTGKSIPDKAEFYREILTAMTGNVNFPTPDPALVDVKTAINAMTDAYEAALNGGKNLKKTMKAREQECDDIVTLLLDYVQFATKRDPEKILSSKFGIKQLPKSTGPVVDTPESLRTLPSGVSGIAYLLWKISKTGSKAVAYEIHRCPDPVNDANWVFAGMVTGAKFKSEPLPAGSVQWFRVRAIGTRKRNSGWSVPFKVVIS